MLPQRQDTPGLTDHWTPMPEFDAERALLACYATFEGREPLFDLVEAYQAPLRGIDGFAVVDRPWLHSTVQGVAFLDDLPGDATDRFVAALRARLAAMPRPVVTVDRPLVRNGGIDLPLSPVVELARVRDVVREAAVAALGPIELYALPGQAGIYDPHITLAYANADMPAAPVRELMDAIPHRELELTLDAFSVLELRRITRTWTWTGAVRLPIGRTLAAPLR